MDKKTIITVGVLAAVGYLVWKQTQKKSFANAAASSGGSMLVEYCGQLAGKPESESRGTGLSRSNGLLNKDWQCCSGNFAKRKPNNIGCAGGSVSAS